MSTFNRIGAVVLVLGSLGLLVAKQPDLTRRIERMRPELESALTQRSVQIDPGELVGLMHNNQVRLLLLDVRDEADFNLFHLLDAWNATLDDLAGDFNARIHPESIVVVMSNGEQRASDAWKILRAKKVVNSYLLEGGINGWLGVYGPHTTPRPTLLGVGISRRGGGDPMHYSFPAALGDRTEAAWPDPHHVPAREFTTKVKVLKPIALDGGGCG